MIDLKELDKIIHEEIYGGCVHRHVKDFEENIRSYTSKYKECIDCGARDDGLGENYTVLDLAIPEYSKDIALARRTLRVLEAMGYKSFGWVRNNKHQIQFSKSDIERNGGWQDTEAKAICYAALAVIKTGEFKANRGSIDWRPLVMP